MFKRRLLFLVCLCVWLVPTFSIGAQDQTAVWTFMQYFSMDNDLEGQIYGDLIEMANVGSTADVNIVAQVDRSAEHFTGFGDWSDTRRFVIPYIEQRQFSTEDKIIELVAFLLSTPDDVGLDALRAEVSALYAQNPDDVRQLLASAGVDMDDITTIDKLFANIGLGRQFDLEAVEALGEVDMGTAEALADFVIWSITNFPAEKYALVISSHGAGWLGNGPDQGMGASQLTMPEIDAALTRVRAQTGVDQLEIVGFDACLMGQLEVYATLAPHARYVIAAEEVIPGQGWEYTAPFTALIANPAMDGAQLGQVIVDAYAAYYAGPGARTGVDLHVIDTAAVAPVVAALDTFAEIAAGEMLPSLSAIGTARNNTQIYGGNAADVLASFASADYYATIDLVNLLGLIASQSAISDDLYNAAQTVLEAIPAMVISSYHDAGLTEANGVAIYFPTNRALADLPPSDTESLLPYPESIPAMTRWYDFLTAWFDTTESELRPEDLSITITEVLPGEDATIYDPPVVLFDTDGQGIADLTFSAVLQLEDGAQIMYDYSPLVFETVLADGTVVNEYPNGLAKALQFQWNVEIPVISDGVTSIPSLLQFSPGRGATTGYVAGVFVPQNGEDPISASVLFSTDTRTALQVYGTAEGGAPYEISPTPGDKFEPYYAFFDPEGNFGFTPAGEQLSFGTSPFTFSYQPAPSGLYNLTMRLVDFAGNAQISSALVSIDNTDLDPAYRGFKDIYWGINFLYPWGWEDPTNFAGEDGSIEQLAVTNPDGDLTIYVSASDIDADTALANAQDLIASLDAGEFYETLDASEIGYAAQVFDYSYSLEGEARIGRIIVINVPENGLTYTIDLDTSAAKIDEASLVFEALINSLTFFEPILSE